MGQSLMKEDIVVRKEGMVGRNGRNVHGQGVTNGLGSKDAVNLYISVPYTPSLSLSLLPLPISPHIPSLLDLPPLALSFLQLLYSVSLSFYPWLSRFPISHLFSLSLNSFRSISS